ncbi:MAG: hypothetical protein JXA43_00760 [Candidatus Diapherotrites archaeon]|nr:hypothetical protein [Candidatus Diapherotrites archaeon]
MIKLDDVRDWKRSIDAISALISEGNFEFGGDGVVLRAIDPSQVAYVFFKMPKASFAEFEMPDAKIGLDLVELAKVVARAMPEDQMLLSFEGSDLILTLEGAITRRFKLPLLDISADEIPQPSPDFTADIEVDAKILKEAFKDAALFSSSVILRVRGDQLIIEAQGSQGNLRTVVPSSKRIKISSSEEVVSKYSLNFLNNILKEADGADTVKISLKSESPMRVSYKIGKAEIAYYLAHMLL